MEPENIPAELRQFPQWVVWQPLQRGDKTTKPPHNARTGNLANKTNPADFSDFQTAVNMAARNGFKGIGFVFREDDPFTGIDLDHVLNPETGELLPWAAEIVEALNSYTEVSPSGDGLHIIIKGRKPGKDCKKGPFEMYDSSAYFTVTGNIYQGRKEIHDRQAELEKVYFRVWPPSSPVSAPKAPAPEAPKARTDEQIIDKASKASNGGKFRKLWAGDWTGYPSQSEADLALCGLLAFYTGPDVAPLSSLYRQSGLANTEKNGILRGESQDYVESLARTAIANCREFYSWEKKKQKPKPKPLPNPEASFNLTDLGNAQRLVALHGQDIRYCYVWKTWMIWDGKRWVKDDLGTVEKFAKNVARSIYKEAAREVDDNKRKALVDHARATESEKRRKDLIASSRSEPGIPVKPDDFDRNPWLLNAQNCVIDLNTWETFEHRREDLITKLAGTGYDPEADCPTFKAFLHQIMDGNQNLVDYIQRVIGYTLSGSTQERAFFFLHGTGANGKSTLLNVVKELMGDYARVASADTFMEKKFDTVREDIARLKGARFVCSSETDEGKRLAEGLIKNMTGTDIQTARFMYGNTFEFVPEFKIFLAANHQPVVKGTDLAIWDRIKKIPFDVRIQEEEQDKSLGTKLKAELPGILNWALDGFKLWRENGLMEPEEVNNATQEYRDDMDTLKEFFSEYVKPDPMAATESAKLFKLYQIWALDIGEKYILSRREFGLRMTDRGLKKKAIHNKNNYLGIAINERGNLALIQEER